jgi:tetratricopeptide (TPR) repeat protein
LRAGRSVAVTGVGGIGKTTVGATVIAGWLGDVFWHTFRPGLNDDLNGLLFSLGHFTREAGAPTLWAQLLAGEGRIGTPGQALGMLRLDLEGIAERQPLLCFDEVDLLQTSAGDPRRKQHAQVLELLESLRDVAPLLLIGQRVYVDADFHFPLEPLSLIETGRLLSDLGFKSDDLTLRRVQQFTQGNPRLLELYAALRHSGDDTGDILRLSRGSSAQPLFSRLWRRLDENERDLLAMLSVFRSYAPRDVWSDRESALEDLIRRGLIKADLAGGITLLPFHRELVYSSLSSARRVRLHKEAAYIRAQRGDYTAAAYHYVQADEPESAADIWFAHQDGEIMAGQAAAADEIFRQIEPNQLDGPWRNELHVIHNRLALLAGEAERVLEGMEDFSWDVDDETTAEVLGQWGRALELRDQAQQALDKYDEAIEMLSRIASKVVGWRLRRAFVYLNEKDLIAAGKEAQLAVYDVERLQGTIDYITGRFDGARTHFLEALRIAETAADEEKIARAHHMLAVIAGRAASIDDARVHAETAMAHFAAIGDKLQLEGTRAELAGMYLNVRQFEKVIEPSEQALRFFERVKHDLWVSTISTNLAEAYLETGRLDEAKEMAFKALRMEMPNARPYALYSLGHVHDRQGNPAHAATSFTEGIETARANGDPFIEAYLQRALGLLLVRNEHAADGIAHLEEALRLFGNMGLQHEVTETETVLRAAGSS